MSFTNRLFRNTSVSYLNQVPQPQTPLTISNRTCPYTLHFSNPYASVSQIYNQSAFQQPTMPYFYLPPNQPYFSVLQQGTVVQQPQQSVVQPPQQSVAQQTDDQLPTNVTVLPAPAPAPTPAPAQNVAPQDDNPLDWAMHSQEMSAVYNATPPKNINTTGYAYIIVEENTDDNKFYLANPIFDGKNDGQLCHDYFDIPIEQATFMGGCLKDMNCDPTAVNIRAGFKTFVKTLNDKKGEGHVFFSGHGLEQPGGSEEDLVGEEFGTTNAAPGGNSDAANSGLISDRFTAKALGSDLHPEAELYFVDDSCHGGGANWPFVLRANEMGKGVQPNPEGDPNMANSGRSMVFTTCLKAETAADGEVGKGGAGTIAFRRAIAKCGFNASCEDIVKTAQADLDSQGLNQHVSIFSNRPFKGTDPFYSERVTKKIDQSTRDLRNIPVLHASQKKHLEQHQQKAELAAIKDDNVALREFYDTVSKDNLALKEELSKMREAIDTIPDLHKKIDDLAKLLNQTHITQKPAKPPTRAAASSSAAAAETRQQ